MQKPIPYGKHHITEDDIQAVNEVLRSDNLTQGPKIAEFEAAFAVYIGSRFAVAVANGTAALHLSTLTIGIKPGEKVITTPITFSATANCIRYCGGEVVFADIDPESYLLDINEVRMLLQASPHGTYKGIILVDFTGRPVNLEAFKNLADEYGLWIIEDACHAPGGYFFDSQDRKQYCGNGNYADLSIFSFHPVKHIACGEGGMITTNNEGLYKKLLLLRNHGITRSANLFQNSIDFANSTIPGTRNLNSHAFSGWYMEMQELGFNYRLTDFQAALGLSQLNRANEGLIKRKEIAAQYYDSLKTKVFIIGQSGLLEGHAYHLYVVEVHNRQGLYNHLSKNKIFTQVHYIPVHLMPYYRQFGWKEGDMPNAEQFYSRCLSLPMYPSLTREEQEYVIGKISSFFS